MANVLIIDDAPAIIHLATRSLQKRGHEARGATTMADALRVFEDFGPDVVFCDVQMPDVEDLEIFEALAERGARVVAMSGVVRVQPDSPIERRFKELGVVEFLPKPFLPDTIREVAERVLSSA